MQCILSEDSLLSSFFLENFVNRYFMKEFVLIECSRLCSVLLSNQENRKLQTAST